MRLPAASLQCEKQMSTPADDYTPPTMGKWEMGTVTGNGDSHDTFVFLGLPAERSADSK